MPDSVPNRLRGRSTTARGAVITGLEIEPEWTEGNGRRTEYPSLPAGAYTFEVMARSAEGKWSVEPARVSFRILPPWWQTVWFSLLAALLFACRSRGSEDPPGLRISDGNTGIVICVAHTPGWALVMVLLATHSLLVTPLGTRAR